jgi:predicted RNA-binding protein with PUA-like domain
MKNTITEKDVKTNYFIPKILREARKKQSNSIRIVHESLDHYQLEKIKEPLETVEKVNLSENKLR